MTIIDTPPSAPAGRHSRTVQGAATAVVAALALVATVLVVLWTTTGQRVDDRAMHTVMAGREAELSLLSWLGRTPMVALVVVAVGGGLIALARGRVRLAVGALVVVAGANVTTQLLKRGVLERPDLGLGEYNSLPSGHTTLAASAVAVLALVVPRALVWLVALGGSFAVTLTGASTLVAGWHRPGDVVAALAVTTVWFGIAVACVGGRARPVAAVPVLCLAGAGAAVVALVAVGVRPVMGWGGLVDAALVIGAVAGVTALFVWAMARLGD